MLTSAPLRLTLSADGNTLLAAGELDLTTKAAFVQALSPLLALPRTDAVPHLDFTALDFMDSAGLESLVWASRHLAEDGRRLHLRVRSKSQPGRVLRLGRFDKLMQIDFVSY